MTMYSRCYVSCRLLKAGAEESANGSSNVISNRNRFDYLLPSRLIALEGIDQAGKKTQTRLLSASLRREGFKVGTLSFPIYSTSSGRLIRAFLEKVRRNYRSLAHKFGWHLVDGTRPPIEVHHRILLGLRSAFL